MGFKTKLSGLAIFLVAQQVSAAPISSFDQFTLELLNSVRANPQAFADTHLAGNLNEGLSAGTIGAGARQPLAWNLNLVSAAQGHTNDMINNNFFAHNGSNGKTPTQRMVDAGYTAPFSGGENLSTRGQSGLSSVTAEITEQMNIDLFVDEGVAGRGHRINMLNGNYESVGISVGFSPSFTPLQGYPSDVVTLDFGAKASQGAFLTGVAYNDANTNNFYTPGEGLGGLSVLAYQAGTTNLVKSTTTLEAGGYALDLGAGVYDLQIAGSLGGLFIQNITLGSQNLKFDYTQATVAAVPVPAAVWLFASGLLGIGGFRSKIKTA